MMQILGESRPAHSVAGGLTRRDFIGWSAGASAALVLFRQGVERVEAADATPVAVDPGTLQQLTDLSQVLCGGGTFNSDRATKLYQIIFTDPALEDGFHALTANPPVAGQPIEPDIARATAQVILLFWFADIYEGEPLPDRGSAYYQLTSWQAMYTFSWAVCHFYGGWANPPADGPLTPANSVS